MKMQKIVNSLCHVFTKLNVYLCFNPFCVILLQVRNDTSQIVNENLPQIQQKSNEMRQIYRKIDKLEVSICFLFSGCFIQFNVWSFCNVHSLCRPL